MQMSADTNLINPLAAPVPAELGPWNVPITFSGGVPVGGQASLKLSANGAYHFSGHFHVSGIPSYDVAIVWAVKSSTGKVFLFRRSGHLHGTFEPGSRDYNWNLSGTNPALAAEWRNLVKHPTYKWNAQVNMAIGSLIDAVKKAIGVIGPVIAIV